MPRYKTPIELNDGLLLDESQARALFDAVPPERMREKILVALCAKAGARTNEMTPLKKESFKIYDDHFQIIFLTEKMGGDEGAGDFKARQRLLEFSRPKGVDLDIYKETIIRYVESLAPGELVFGGYGDRWMQKRLNILGEKVLGKPICVYHFRHAAVNREGNKGHGRGEQMHFKGTRSPRSVDAYTHSTPYRVD